MGKISLSPWQKKIVKSIISGNFLENHRIFKALAHDIPFDLLIGQVEIDDLKLYISPHTLIPRPVTEILAEFTASIIKKALLTKPLSRINIVDVGCGTGFANLMILKKLFKPATLQKLAEICTLFIDNVPQALELARKNFFENLKKIHNVQPTEQHKTPLNILSIFKLMDAIFLSKNKLTTLIPHYSPRDLTVIFSNPPYVDIQELTTELLFENTNALITNEKFIQAILTLSSLSTTVSVIETNPNWKLEKHREFLKIAHTCSSSNRLFFIREQAFHTNSTLNPVIGYLVINVKQLTNQDLLKICKTLPLELEPLPN